jgi:hypothetical protein
MPLTSTEIKVFPEGSRKASLVISSLIPKNALAKLSEKLGVETAKQAEKAMRSMKANNMDLVQIRTDDGRIRIAEVV